VEQNIGPGYEVTQLYPPYFLTKVPIIYNGEKTASSTNVAGISGYPSARNRNQINVNHPVIVLSQIGSRT
jgi:hypothetical protein